MTFLKMGVIGTSKKEDERRFPIHPEHLSRLPENIRKQLIFEKGYGGVDIGPLKESYPNIPLFGFVPDSQRYFDYHHSNADVFESVNKRELELGSGAMATIIYNK